MKNVHPNTDLAEILNAVQTGDTKAWNTLVQAEGNRVYRLARAVTHDDALAEDVVQEVFLKIAQRRLPRLRRGRGTRYLTQMTTRAAIDASRKRDTRRRYEEGQAMIPPKTPEDPVAATLAAEASQHVREALDALPPQTRAALWLHVVEQVGIRDVAKALGTSRSSAFDRIRSGKERVKRFLQGRGIVVPAALGWSAALEGAVPKAPATLLESLAKSGSAALGSPHAGAEASGVGASAASKGLAVAALTVLLGGVAFWAVVHLAGRSPTEVVTPEGAQHSLATEAQVPTRTSTPPGTSAGERLDPPPAANASATEAVALFELAGIVFNRETRLPIEGAVVRPAKPLVTELPEEAKLEVTTDQHGFFRLVLPEGIEHEFETSATGFFSESRTIGSQTGELNVSLLPRLEVSGWVRDLDDQPLPNATLTIGGTSVGPRTTYLARTLEDVFHSAEDGSFRVPMRMFGQPRLCAFKEGYGGTVALGIPPATQDFTIRVPPGGEVLGKVIGLNGAPVENQRIAWLTESPAHTRWKGETRTDGSGNFVLRGLPAPGLHWVFLADLSPTSRRSVLRQVTKTEPTLVRSIQLESQETVRGVTFHLEALERWREEEEKAKEGNASGVNRPDARASQTRPPARPGELRIEGVVRDPNGVPIQFAMVRASAERNSASSSNQCMSVAGGRFSITIGHLSLGTHSVEVIATHGAWARARVHLEAVEVAAREDPANEGGVTSDGGEDLPDVGPLELDLTRGCHVTGIVAGSSGPRENVQVLVHTSAELHNLKYFGRTDSEGRFELERLDPETDLQVTFYDPEFALATRSYPSSELHEGGTIDFGRVVLRKGGILEGTVLEADGMPAAFQLVTFEGRFLHPPARTDEAGRFRLEHVLPGERETLVLGGDETLLDGGRRIVGEKVFSIDDGTVTSVVIRLGE